MKQRTILAVVVVALLTLTGCSSQGGQAPGSGTSADSSSGVTKVSIGGVVTTSTVPISLGQSEGIFKKHGLDVTMEPTQNFAAAVPSLMNGKLDFAIAAVPPFIIALQQRMPLVAVAGTSATVADSTQEGNQVVVRRGSGIKTLAELEGKKVATNQVGSGPYVGVLATYLRSGGAPDGIEWVSMPMNEQVAGLESGSIDAAVLAEPYTGMALADGNVPLASAYRDPQHPILNAGDPYVVVLTSKSYAEKNPKIVAAMRDALDEANAFAADHHDKVVDVLVSETGMDAKVAATIKIPGFVGKLTGAELQRLADAMLEVGLLKKKFDGAAAVWQPAG
ncbi:ABC transporter substrate-binding protein [Microbacterium kribbense]|uniref:ABC transporter substrate-binding protein n=1 Tax=Microbacterium kribbense TaxID=433645 RepID=A0ABP7GYD5_9MICO